MAADTRQRMIDSAAELFRDRGYDGTGFRDVVTGAGAARGVIYHHFPGGKVELGVLVVEHTGGKIAALVEAVCATSSPGRAVEVLCDVMDKHLIRGHDRAGCPVLAVAYAADDDDGLLRGAAHEFFGRVRTALHDCLVRDGIASNDARAFAALALSAAEGAIVLCRADGDSEPLRLVRRSLLSLLEGLPRQA